MRKKKRFGKDVLSATTPDQEASDSKYSYLYNMPSSPETATATVQAVQSGGNPSILDKAKKALDSKDYLGLCERFVEMTQGTKGQFSSAINAWNGQKEKVQGLDGVQPGDAIYFAPDKSNSGFGHTGVYTGDGKMISATNGGVKETPLGDWVKSTGQKVLGYVPKG